MTISRELLDELLSGVERPEDLLGDKGLMKELKLTGKLRDALNNDTKSCQRPHCRTKGGCSEFRVTGLV